MMNLDSKPNKPRDWTSVWVWGAAIWAWAVFIAYHAYNGDYYRAKFDLFGKYFLGLFR